jgi:XTP/dITP diphosphohydrolase
MKILFASRNRDKLKEVSCKVEPFGIEVLSPNDFTNLPEIEEDGETLAANAQKKALTLHRLSNLPTLADDTGLEVEALGGRPGVYSSRFAGPGATYADNVDKLLRDMAGVPREKRRAAFRCVLAYVHVGKTQCFEGIIAGLIAEKASGQNGFGYDPIFYVPDEKLTFAELTLERKNQISHRGRALDAFVEYLRRTTANRG